MRTKALLTVVLLVAGCRSTGAKLNELSVGMTKAEVLGVMGTPDSTAANGGAEFLRFRLAQRSFGATYYDDYFVKLVNGRVESYGRVGDFDSTKQPEQTINVNVNDNSK